MLTLRCNLRMKFPRRCLLLVSLPIAAFAQTTLYWDTDGATAGLGNGAGSWNAAHWSTSSSGEVATGAWVNGSIARFNAFGGSVLSLDADVTAAGLYAAASSGLTLGGTGILTLSSGAVIHNGSAMILGVTIAGNTTPGQTAFTLDGSYPVYFNASNTYTGQTVVTGGNVAIANAQSLGATGTGNETIFTGGGGQFLQFASDMTLNEGFTFAGYRYLSTPNNSVVTLAGPIVLQGGGSMGLWSGDNLTISGVISETGGAGTFAAYATLTGTNTFTGALEVGRVVVGTFNNAGVAGPLGAGNNLQLGYAYEGAASGEIVYTGSSATSNRAIRLFGEGTITVENALTALTLSGVISNDGGMGAEASPDLIKAGPGALILRGNNTYTGNTLLTNGVLIIGHNNALGTDVEAELEIGTYDTVYDDDLSVLLEGGVTLGRSLTVFDENNDGGTTTLGMGGPGIATFAGDAYLYRGIRLNAVSGAELRFTGTVQDDYYSGSSLNKTGAGLVVLNGPVTLTNGGVTVSQGELRVNGSAQLYNGIEVQSGATLSGTGTVTGAVTVLSGAKLSPGTAGAGTLTVSGLTLASGSTVNWRLGELTTAVGAGTAFDRVLINSQEGEVFGVGGGVELTVDLSLLAISLRPVSGDRMLNDPFWQVERVWSVFDFSGPGTNGLTPGAAAPFFVDADAWVGGTFDTFVGGGAGEFAGYNAGDVYLRFTPVPEPSTYALFGLGTLALLLPRLRRRS